MMNSDTRRINGRLYLAADGLMIAELMQFAQSTMALLDHLDERHFGRPEFVMDEKFWRLFEDQAASTKNASLALRSIMEQRQ